MQLGIERASYQGILEVELQRERELGFDLKAEKESKGEQTEGGNFRAGDDEHFCF